MAKAKKPAKSEAMEGRLFVRLPQDMLDELEMFAALEDRSVANLSRRAIEEGLDQYRKRYPQEYAAYKASLRK